MKLVAAFLLVFATLHAAGSFITQEEYSEHLYNNPRGIGCHHCHGAHGEGKEVASYEHKGVKKTFKGSAINTLDFAAFKAAMNRRIRGMPRYFLTDKEIKALYHHVTVKPKQEETAP